MTDVAPIIRTDTPGGFDPGVPFSSADKAKPDKPAEPAPRLAPQVLGEIKATDLARELIEASRELDALAGAMVGASMVMTEREAAYISVGLARYLNRTPSLRKQFASLDYLKALYGGGHYGARVYLEHLANKQVDELQSFAGLAPADPAENTTHGVHA